MAAPRGLHLVVAFLAFGLLVGSEAKADFFAYSSTVSVANAPTLPANPPGAASAVSVLGAGDTLTWNTSSAANINGSLPGGANINYGSVVFGPGATSTVVTYDINFNYQVTITDSLGHSGVVNFTGELKGVARGAPQAINGTFLNYAVNPTSLVLDGKTFLISLGVNTSPGSVNNGVLQGNVQITAVPEPVSLALVGLGGICLHAFHRRRKQRPA
jgi:hypothetical protein